MDTITLTIKNKEKFLLLMEFLKQLDVVEVSPADGKKIKKAKHNIFKSAGLWEDRDISLEQIREQAWARTK